MADIFQWVCVFWIAITDQGKWLLRAARNPLNDSNSDVMAAKLINKFHLNPGWSHEYIKYMNILNQAQYSETAISK